MGWTDIDRTRINRNLTLTSVKIAAYTAIANDHVLVDANAAAGDFAITLPATPSIGDLVRITMATQHVTRKVTINDNGLLIKGNGSNNVYYDLCLNGDTVQFRWLEQNGNPSLLGWAVDYDGIMPHQCRLTRAAVQSISYNTWTDVTLDAKEYDIGGIGDIVTNNRIDIRRSGYYRVTIYTSLDSIYENENYAGLYINNTLFLASIAGWNRVGVAPTSLANMTWFFNSGDYLKLRHYQDHSPGTSANTFSAASQRDFISIYEVRSI